MESALSENKARKSMLATELDSLDKTFAIKGIIKLVLSNLTQIAVGCVVGVDITADSNWIFIRKEKLADNLELHEGSSDFLPIKKLIMRYSEEDMLLGFIGPVEDDKQLFYVCTTVESKNTVVKILEKQKDELHEKLLASIYRVPKTWTSYGSETEVDDSIIKNFRPLIEVEVESKYPLYSEKKKFKPRLVADAIDGYIEILPGRFAYSNVLKRRIDAAIQVTPSVVENEAQTNPTYPKNIYTQYNYEYKEPKLNRFHYEHLNKFLKNQVESLGDIIHVNQNINLYTNEYLKFSQPIAHNTTKINGDLLSFRDVITCKDKSVADVELHPLMSNILATAYSKYTFNKIVTGPPTDDEINTTTFGKHLALLWCNSDPLKPRLFLYCDREINVVRFCPFRADILLGGCCNGQIVLWDLAGRLEKVETREILTPSELKHRMIMQSMMTWAKNTYNISVVYPTLVTAIDGSHNAPVTKVAWILPNYRFTKNGKFEACAENESSFQFATAAMDGRILIWDLENIPNAPKTQEKKSQRLAKRPSALTSDVSDLQHMNNILQPLYKINLRNKSTTIPYPISSFFFKSLYLGFKYEVLNPETLHDVNERTYFKLIESKTRTPGFSPFFTASDNLGNIFQCSIEGHEYDQGQKLNYENCSYTPFDTVHDGPIRSLYPNYSDSSIVLTVGGHVFAIWDVNVPPKPLFYRKSKHRYVAGVWSVQQAGSVSIAREDSYFECWEFLQRTKSPARVFRMTGNTITDVHRDLSRFHMSKDTFITTDVVGAVRVYKILQPRSLSSSQKEFIFFNMVRNRILKRMERNKKWIESYKKKYLQKNTEVAEETTPVEIAPDAKKSKQDEAEENNKESVIDKLKPQSGNSWAEKQEKIMYRILLEKKKLNLAEIEKNKIPLQKLYKEQQHKGKKTVEMLEKKEEIFLAAKKRLFKAKEIKKKKKISISFSKEVEDVMKESFIERYNEMLEDTLNYVQSNEFHYMFDWGGMITKGRERRKCSTTLIGRKIGRKSNSDMSDQTSKRSQTIDNSQGLGF